MNNNEIHVCAYCGQPAKYQLKNGKWCCNSTYQKCPILRKKYVSNRSVQSYKDTWNKLSDEQKQKMLSGIQSSSA